MESGCCGCESKTTYKMSRQSVGILPVDWGWRDLESGSCGCERTTTYKNVATECWNTRGSGGMEIY